MRHSDEVWGGICKVVALKKHRLLQNNITDFSSFNRRDDGKTNNLVRDFERSKAKREISSIVAPQKH